MCADWTNHHDIDLLIRKLEATKKSSSGVTAFVGIDADDALAVLHSSLKFAKGVSELEQTRILNGAALTVGDAGKITKTNLLAEIKQREIDHLRLPHRSFVLASNLSIRYFDELLDAQIDGCRITFSRQLPKRFREEHREALRRQLHSTAEELPKTGAGSNAHTAVRVTTKARTDHDAALTAASALTLLRGIWNLYRNLGRGQTFPPPLPRRPINEILFGPAHTVHERNGKLSSDTVWFETSYQRSVKPFQLQRDWLKIKDFERNARTWLKRSRYRGALEEAIRRYTQALDLTDWNASFIQMWSLLEYLTNSGPHYDTTKKRTLFVCPNNERDLHREVLEHLRIYRNATVHAAEQKDDLLTLVYQVKRYVEWLLWFHFGVSSQFHSIADAGDYLHLPSDPELLRQRKRLLKKALQYQIRDIP